VRSSGIPKSILVINPNSNNAVTNAMSDALSPLRIAGGPQINCATLSDGPFGIESDDDAAAVVPLVETAIGGDVDADAFVIACYSDPGLQRGRAVTSRPVFGIAECAALTAVTRGGTFGVISILDQSIPRHQRHLEDRGLAHLCAADRAINMSVAETASGEGTLARMIEVGRVLRDQDGASSIILGCAGMARHREPLEAEIGMPVIDPVQAAVTMAIGAVCLNQ